MTLQEEVSTSKAKKQTVDPTDNTIESIGLTRDGDTSKLRIKVLETGQEYSYSLKELYWYDIDELIRGINRKTEAYIPEPLVGKLVELYESIEYEVDNEGDTVTIIANVDAEYYQDCSSSVRDTIDSVSLADIAINGEDAFEKSLDRHPVEVKSTLETIIEAVQEQAETKFINSDVRWKLTRTWTAGERLHELVVRFEHHLLDDIHVATIHTENEEFVGDDLQEHMSDDDFHVLGENVDLYVDERFDKTSICEQRKLRFGEHFVRHNVLSAFIVGFLSVVLSPFGIITGLLASVILSQSYFVMSTILFVGGSPFVSPFIAAMYKEKLATGRYDDGYPWGNAVVAGSLLSPVIHIFIFLTEAKLIRYRFDKEFKPRYLHEGRSVRRENYKSEREMVIGNEESDEPMAVIK